jgi:hypothetical protein
MNKELPCPGANSPQSLCFAMEPGGSWRVLARGDNGEPIEPLTSGTFDELVVDHWLHIEQMDTRVWWLRVGDARLMATIEADGRVVVDVLRGFYEVTSGTSGEWVPPG